MKIMMAGPGKPTQINADAKTGHLPHHHTVAVIDLLLTKTEGKAMTEDAITDHHRMIAEGLGVLHQKIKEDVHVHHQDVVVDHQQLLQQGVVEAGRVIQEHYQSSTENHLWKVGCK